MSPDPEDAPADIPTTTVAVEEPEEEPPLLLCVDEDEEVDEIEVDEIPLGVWSRGSLAM